MHQREIASQVYDLYDQYCHGQIDRREFLSRAAALTIGGVSALAMAQALLPRYIEAQTISFTDERIKPLYVGYPSPGGTSGKMLPVTHIYSLRGSIERIRTHNAVH